MLNSRKNFPLCATKTNILTLVLSEKNIVNETKNHNTRAVNNFRLPFRG